MKSKELPIKSTQYDPRTLMLAHFNSAELDMFDKIQGGKDINNEFQLRQYPALVDAFANPEVREVFEAEMSKWHTPASQKEAPNNPILQHLSDNAQETYEKAPGDYEPEAQELISHGTNGDDEIAFMPVGVLDYFDAIIGRRPKPNKDGLPQYSFWNKPWKAIKGSFRQLVRHPIKYVTTHTLGNKIGGALDSGLKTIARHPIVKSLSFLGGALGAGAVSRYGGSSWKDTFKDAAIGGIVGAASMVGGPMIASGLGVSSSVGAGLGAGIGHYGGTMVVGRKPNAMESLGVGAGAMALHGWNPTTGLSGLATNASSNFGNAYNSAAGALGFGGGAAPGAGLAAGTNAGGAGSLLPVAAAGSPGTVSGAIGALTSGAGAAGAAGAGTAAATTGGLFGMGGALGTGLSGLQLAGLGGAGYLLSKGMSDQKKKNKQAQEEADRRNKESAEYVQNLGRENGFYQPLGENLQDTMTAWTPTGEKEPLVLNPRMPSYEDTSRGIAHRWYIPRSEALAQSRFAKGGKVEIQQTVVKGHPGQAELIVGKGTGQSDSIPYDFLDEGDYIMDAHTVSGLGDGSTKGGADQIERLIQTINHRKQHIPAVTSGKKVPAMLSDSEYRLPSQFVTKLGDGSNQKGTKILDKMRVELRKDKLKGGTGLPPKSKDVFVYLKKAGGRI